MKALCLFFCCVLIPGLAFAGLSYKDYELKPAPQSYAQELEHKFQESGFYSLVQLTHGIPSLGLNQVFFKSEDQFVMVKYGVEGTFPLDEIITTPKGFIVHQSGADQKFMLYFRGFTLDGVKVMLNRLKRKVSRSSVFDNLLIPSAQADACGAFGAPVVPQAGEMKSISAGAAWESLKSCMSGLGEGVYGSTVGVVKGVASEIMDFLSGPIDYVEKVADKVELFLVKTAKFIKGLITNPAATLKSIGKGLGKTWDTVSDTVTNMSTEMKINFVCSFIGVLGVDAAITFLTGGGGASKVLLTIEKLAAKFTKMAKVLRLLSKVSSQTLNRLKLSGDKMEKFMKGLFHNKFPDEDLAHLDDLTHMGDELSLRTLSCYVR